MHKLIGIAVVLALTLAGLPALVAVQGAEGAGATNSDEEIASYQLAITGGTPRPSGPFGNAPVAIGTTTSPTPAREPRSRPVKPVGRNLEEGGGDDDADPTGFLGASGASEDGGGDSPK